MCVAYISFVFRRIALLEEQCPRGGVGSVYCLLVWCLALHLLFCLRVRTYRGVVVFNWCTPFWTQLRTHVRVRIALCVTALLA